MCIQWTHVIYSVEIKRQFNPPFHNSTVCVMNSGQCSYTIHNDTLSGEFGCKTRGITFSSLIQYVTWWFLKQHLIMYGFEGMDTRIIIKIIIIIILMIIITIIIILITTTTTIIIITTTISRGDNIWLNNKSINHIPL